MSKKPTTTQTADETTLSAEQTAGDTVPAAETTQTLQSAEIEEQPERIRESFEHGPIERTLSRMIAAWKSQERNRGTLTAEFDEDAQKAIEQLELVGN